MILDYQTLKENFSWEDIKDKFVGDPGGIMNAAVEACDKWAERDKEKIAILWEDEQGNEATLTYLQLKEKSNQVAHALQALGVKRGDRVAGLLGKEIELVVAIFAVMKMGAIYVPLFTAFGPDGILQRAESAGVSFLITDKEQNSKLEGRETSFKTWVIDEVNEEGQTFWAFVNSFSTDFTPVETQHDETAVIQFTSGTTGMPKGAMFGHKMLYSLYPYLEYGFDLTEDDVFFGGADLGWAYGLVACTFGPLSFGAKVVLYKGPFHPVKTIELLDKYQVTNFAHAPTAYRFIKSIGTENLKNYSIVVKKFNSAGEPIDGEVVQFFEENYGRAIYDHYGSTEVSMIINNYNKLDMKVKPGSMGFPVPGFDIDLIDGEGNSVKQGEVGQIAIDFSNPNLGFLGYWEAEDKLQEKMYGDWFLTGDLARKDEDGYFWFHGRTDDIIVSAGYRIGPTEVEASLMVHPAVVEAVAVGKPDPEKGEVVKAFVLLKPEIAPTEALKDELRERVRSELSKHQYPQDIEFVEELPKTPSGKTQRFILKQREQEKYEAAQQASV